MHTLRRPSRSAPRFTRAPSRPTRGEIAACLAIFVTLFFTLQMTRLTGQSATWDEPMHLTAGYAAVAHGDFRIDPTHPPLARAWAAIPLWLSGRQLDTAPIDRVEPVEWLSSGYGYARDFVSAGDLDTTLTRARLMAVLWGVLLGVVVFAWALEWKGFQAALLALALFTLEPNVAAHTALVTTDAPLATLVFAAAYFLWRLSRRYTVLDLAGLTLCVALAAVTKFSAILLIPLLLMLLAVAALRGWLRWRQAWTVVGATAAATLITVWAVYGFRYAPSATSDWLFRPVEPDGTVNLGMAGAMVTWLDAHHLLPNAYAEGLLFSVNSARELPSFLAGRVQQGGWWYYFPLAIALKTPLAILALGMVGIAWMVRHPGERQTAVFVTVPVCVWLVVAARSNINIGVRHVLPIFPFLVLIAAMGAASLLSHHHVGRALVTGALLLAAVEVQRSGRYPLSFFNALAGGPENGFRYLADSNLGWGGNLEALKRWMDERGITSINLAYFGSVDPAVYGIDATYLPTSALFLADRFSRPQLPGYVAISGTSLDGVYLPDWWRAFYAPFRDREPAALVANTMRIYWVNRWPEPATLPPASQRTLAQALHFGLRWPDPAIPEYQKYLQTTPGDVAAWKFLSVALAEAGRSAEALEGFRRALKLSPSDPEIRGNIALLERQAGTTGAYDR